MTTFNLRRRVQSFKDCEHNFKVLDWLLMGRTDHANTLLPGVIKLNEFGISCERGDEITFWLKADGSAEFSGDLKAASGTFNWLQAGIKDGARMWMGIDEDEKPTTEMYDDNNFLRVKLKEDEVEFWRNGLPRGRLKAEFVSDYWRGGQVGECLYMEAEGNALAFKTKGEDGTVSFIVWPTWVWAKNIETEFISLGKDADPPEWVLLGDWKDPLDESIGQFLELQNLGWVFSGATFGLITTTTQFSLHGKTQRVGFNFGQDINYHTGIYKDNVRGIPRADLKTATASVSGSLGSNLAVEIELHPYTFFPNMYGADASFFVQPHTDNEVDYIGRMLFANLAASSKSYRCRWRYIDA